MIDALHIGFNRCPSIWFQVVALPSHPELICNFRDMKQAFYRYVYRWPVIDTDQFLAELATWRDGGIAPERAAESSCSARKT